MNKDALHEAFINGNAKPVGGANPTNALSEFTLSGKFSELISSILPTFYILAGVILLFYMIFGGFMIMTSNGDAHKTEDGQKALTNAIIGFVIIFASYWIMQIIQIITGIDFLKGGNL